MPIEPVDENTKTFRAVERVRIPGRGLVVVVDVPNPDRLSSCPGLPTAGEVVSVDGFRYEVRAIEAAMGLTAPPFMMPRVGFLVKTHF